MKSQYVFSVLQLRHVLAGSRPTVKTMVKRIFSGSLLAVLLTLMQTTVCAEGNASIKGAVTDPKGAVISEAQVSVTNAVNHEKRQLKTDSDGRYELSGLDPGSYRIEITATGFAIASKQAQLAAGDSVTVDFQLALQGITDTVTTVVDSYAVTTNSTGMKTDGLILDVPQSIQVIPQTVIQDQQPKNLSGILRNASGFSQTRTEVEVFRSFKLRGFDVLDTTTDGIRNTDSLNIQAEGIANIERVEVLKGPASALYGRGSVGGGINIVTKKPLPDSYRHFNLITGSFDHFQGGIDVAGPFNESKSARYRFIADYGHRDSFINFVDITELQVAPSLQFDLGSKTTLTLQFDYRFHDQPRFIGLPLYGTITGTDDIKLPFSSFFNEPALITKNFGSQSTAIVDHNFSSTWTGRVSARWTQNYFFQPIASPRTVQADNRTLNRGYQLFDELEKEFAIEADTSKRFRHGRIEHTLTAGGDYAWWHYDSKFHLGAIAPINIENPVYGAQPSGVFLLADTRDIISSYGLFVQDQIALHPRLKVVLGGRFDHISNENRDLTIPIAGERKDSQFSPRLGIVFHAAPQVSIYGSYSTSIHPNYGEAFASETAEPFRPQRGQQFEGGVKVDLSRKLFGTVAFYHLTQKDVLVPDPDDPTGFFSIANGEQRSRGMEVDLFWSPFKNIDVLSSYAYTDAEVTKDTIPALIGNRLKNVPKHSGRVWGRYEIPVNDNSRFTFGGGFTFTSELPGDLGNTFVLPGYTVADALASFKYKKITFQVNIYNLFDNEYLHRAAFTATQGIIPGEPLRATGSIAVRF
jgi:iron complex outermembrane receptor protein